MAPYMRLAASPALIAKQTELLIETDSPKARLTCIMSIKNIDTYQCGPELPKCHPKERGKANVKRQQRSTDS
jgi:hypothetical protein